VIAVLDYPLEQALSAYRAVITPMLFVLAGALLVALVGAMLIAHGVSRPLEALATAARRIAQGDYSLFPESRRGDEIGELSTALNNMTQSIAEREAALKGAVASLELARNEAVKANEAKSQFLSNMSHELRTPLNAVIGFSEMIFHQLLGPIGVARYAEYARHVFDSGRHLLVQVEEMLDLSEAESGKLVLKRGLVKPGRAARRESRSARAHCRQRRRHAQGCRRPRVLANDRAAMRRNSSRASPTSSTMRSSSRRRRHVTCQAVASAIS
jgi:signal transduction histidine kinase